MSRRAFFLSTASGGPGLESYAGYPLQTRAYDDTDAFHTRRGPWFEATQAQWPSPVTNNHVSLICIVTAAQTPADLTTDIFSVAGTAQEGIKVCGYNEPNGPLQAYLRCLDYAPNTDWQAFGITINSQSSRYTYKGTGNPGTASNHNFSYPPTGTETYHQNLEKPIIELYNLPPGRYQLRLVKAVNSTSTSDSVAGKYTGHDQSYLFTRVP